MKANHVFSRWLPLAGALGLVFGLASWSSSSPHDKELTVDVIPDLATFSTVEANLGNPFVIEGEVRKAGTTTVIGKYLCRGWFLTPQTNDDATFVHQSFEIFGKGTIHVEGNESPFPRTRAIVAVIGDFKKNEGGTLLAIPMPDELGPLAFTATFRFKN